MEVALPDGRVVKATVSIGLADASESPIEIALKHADDALYEAKRLGRNRVVLSSDPEKQTIPEPDSFSGRLF